jgi:NTP pyrophosphatase (non-canonical NTP hydrolase)
MSRTLSELDNLLQEFEKDNWVAPRDSKSVTRHITQHIAKLIGKLGAVTEKWEHGFEADTTQLKEEVIPDLLYYALNLAHAHEVDLEKAFLHRLEINRQKVDQWKAEGVIPKDYLPTNG